MPPTPVAGGTNKLLFGGIVAVMILAAIGAFLLLKGSGSSKNQNVAASVPTATATSARQAPASVPTSAPAAAATSRPSDSSPACNAGKLADLNSYKFNMKIEGSGGPLSDVASTFGAFQGSAPSATQNLVMEVAGSYVKPDRGQQTLKLGNFTVDFTTIGKQQWTNVFGIQSGPDSASRSTEDYSFAATSWDEGLVDSFSAFGCSGSETVNGVQTKKCGLDASQLSSLIDALGGLTGDPTSGIKSIASGNMQAWLAQQGNYPVRISFDLKGKGSDTKDFALKFNLDITDINSTAIKIDPPK